MVRDTQRLSQLTFYTTMPDSAPVPRLRGVTAPARAHLGSLQPHPQLVWVGPDWSYLYAFGEKSWSTTMWLCISRMFTLQKQQEYVCMCIYEAGGAARGCPERQPVRATMGTYLTSIRFGHKGEVRNYFQEIIAINRKGMGLEFGCSSSNYILEEGGLKPGSHSVASTGQDPCCSCHSLSSTGITAVCYHKDPAPT